MIKFKIDIYGQGTVAIKESSTLKKENDAGIYDPLFPDNAGWNYDPYVLSNGYDQPGMAGGTGTVGGNGYGLDSYMQANSPGEMPMTPIIRTDSTLDEDGDEVWCANGGGNFEKLKYEADTEEGFVYDGLPFIQLVTGINNKFYLFGKYTSSTSLKFNQQNYLAFRDKILESKKLYITPKNSSEFIKSFKEAVSQAFNVSKIIFVTDDTLYPENYKAETSTVGKVILAETDPIFISIKVLK